MSENKIPLFLKENLDPQQLEAASSTNKPLLILAGAGSGKTRTLTYRMAYLVCEGLTRPENILAVTFTNKAARELRERTHKILGELGLTQVYTPWVGTFHSICVKLLKEFYSNSFIIYDSTDQIALIKKILKQLGADEKQFHPKVLRDLFMRAKQRSLLPKDILNNRTALHMNTLELQVFELYESEKESANALDFTDLLLKTVQILKTADDIRKQLSQRFQYIFIDEYQDTNELQYQIVKLLTTEHQNICVVGDEDQSIYSWRGANIKNILNFKKDFKGAKVQKLERNYRSTITIVNAANSLIQNNQLRTPKALFSEGIKGHKIDLSVQPTEYQEAENVAQKILHLQSQSSLEKLSEIGVLYRTNAQSRILEEKLTQNQIPYIIVGGLKFFDRKEVKDILAYLKVLEQPHDSVSLLRIINVPSRKIGAKTLQQLQNFAFEQNISLFEALKLSPQILSSAKSKQVLDFVTLHQKLCNFMENNPLNTLVDCILDETGYIEKLNKENSAEALSRIENIDELKNAINYFVENHSNPSLRSFLSEIALAEAEKENKDANNCVQLMTIHSSKGLEFENVFLVGMEDGIFPSKRSQESEEQLEEERRLAYVAITRAKKRLYLSYSLRRFGNIQRPSPFLREIPSENLTQPIQDSSYLSHNSYREMSPKKSYANSNKHSSSKSKDNSSETYQYENSDLIGTKVHHCTFGMGFIKSVEQTGITKYTIMFKDAGQKVIAADFVTLQCD